MSLRRCITVILLAEASAGLALGDGLFHTLPEDGTWATYSFDGSTTTDTQGLRVKAKLCIASVGRVMADNEPCRWIELQFFDLNIPGPNSRIFYSQSQTVKLLIPEKYLSAGGSPIDHVLRGWALLGPKGRHKPEEVRNINAKKFDWLLFPIILSGPLRNPRRLAATEVDSKLGKASCDGVRGGLSVEIAGNKPPADCELENRLHPKSPFGIVTADYTIKESGDSIPSRLHLKLIDFGKDAISTMPEAK